MRLNRRVPVGTHGGVRGRPSCYEGLLLDYALAGMSGTIPLISEILTQSISKFKGDYYGLQLQSGKARI